MRSARAKKRPALPATAARRASPRPSVVVPAATAALTLNATGLEIDGRTREIAGPRPLGRRA